MRKKGYSILLVFGLFGIVCDTAHTQYIRPEPAEAVILAGAYGFMPMKDSYKVNYQTQTFGLPMMVYAGMMFPANERVSFGAVLHYISRNALFVDDLHISSVELYPSVSYYLEEPQPDEVRIIGRAGLCFVRSVVSGETSASVNGSDLGRFTAEKSYYNIGMGIDLGIEYPLSQTVAINAGLHIASYFSDAVSTGGLGNVGGVSIGAGVSVGL